MLMMQLIKKKIYIYITV